MNDLVQINIYKICLFKLNFSTKLWNFRCFNLTLGHKWLHSLKNSIWGTYDRNSNENSVNKQPNIIITNSKKNKANRQKRSSEQQHITSEDQVRYLNYIFVRFWKNNLGERILQFLFLANLKITLFLDCRHYSRFIWKLAEDKNQSKWEWYWKDISQIERLAFISWPSIIRERRVEENEEWPRLLCLGTKEQGSSCFV